MYTIDTFHFLFLHYPIALFIVAFSFDMAAIFFKKPSLLEVGYWNMLTGLFFSIITIITGLITDGETGINHFWDNPVSLGNHATWEFLSVFILSFIFYRRYKNKNALNENSVIRGLYMLGIIFLIYGSHLGAVLADRL